MTTALVSNEAARYLLAGQLAIDRFNASCASCGGVLVIDGPTWVHRDAGCCVFPDPTRRHLVPVGEKPICPTCGGRARQDMAVIDGVLRAPFDRDCPSCDGSGVPSELTLTVECDECTRGCDLCKGSGQRPVVKVHVLSALQVSNYDCGLGWTDPHVCTSTHDPKLILVGPEHGIGGLDVSHLLLPGVDWVGWALVVDRVKATNDSTTEGNNGK